MACRDPRAVAAHGAMGAALFAVLSRGLHGRGGVVAVAPAMSGPPVDELGDVVPESAISRPLLPPPLPLPCSACGAIGEAIGCGYECKWRQARERVRRVSPQT